MIYLRDARGFPIEQAALMLSTIAIAGLVAAPTTGWLIDRFGAGRVLMSALTTAAVASVLATQVDRVWEGFAWAFLFGTSISAMWPAAHSLMASVVEPLVVLAGMPHFFVVHSPVPCRDPEMGRASRSRLGRNRGCRPASTMPWPPWRPIST